MGNWVTALGIPEVFEGLLCCATSTLSALCSSCNTGYPRFIFSLFLLVGTISSFLVLSPNMRGTLDKLPYFCTAVTSQEMCDTLVGYGAVYRICFSLAMFYGVFALLMLNTESTKDIRVKFHNGYWFLKLVLLVAILVGAFHIPRYTEFGRVWMYVGLTAGFIFIMIQILLVIDFAHSWSFSWAERIESGNSSFWSVAMVSSTVLVYSMAITMAVFYYLYFTDLQNTSKCRGNMFLISFNVFHCLLASVVSILPRVQETSPGSGLLQSSIVSLYTMYLTWCTLSSEPDGACNPMGDVILEYDKISGVNGQAIFDCVLMFALLVFACNVRSSTSKLEKIGFSLSKYATTTRMDYYDSGEKSTLSYREKSDVEKYVGDENIDGEEYVQYNYSFFHFVMLLASLQLMMVVTNWHSPDELADLKKLVKNWATVWIQLSSSFLCVLFYIWATVTPLLVRTWGPCLGLDYECVPTEDDYERVQRRREITRERKEMQGHFRSSAIETDLTNVTKAESLSKNYREERNSVLTKLGNLSLSLVKKQRNEQMTQDSGLCDVTNFTSSYSRSTSRASARPNSPKSTTVETRLSPASEQRSKPVLSNQIICIEKSEVDKQEQLNTVKPHTEDVVIESKHKDTNVASPNLQSACTTAGINTMNSSNKQRSRLESENKASKSARSYDNHSVVNSVKHKTNIRPYSSMALGNKTSSDGNRGSTHNSIDEKALTTRPKTCEPSLTLQKKRLLQGKKEERSFSSDVVEPITKTDNLNVLKPKESLILRNKTDHLLPRKRADIDCSQETVIDRDSKPDTDLLVVERNKEDASSEKAPRTPLQMQDHLKWVKSLCRTRGKVIHSNKQDISETRTAVEGHTNTETTETVYNNSVKVSNTSPGTKKDAIEKHGLGSGVRGSSQMSEIDNKDGGKQGLVNTSESRNGSQSNKDEKNLEQKNRCQSEVQTPGASKEILRLQEKILKFQAKVVKAQQKILEMQQEGQR